MQKVSGQEFYNTSQVDDHICSTCTKLDPLVERALAIPIDIFAAKELNLLHRRGVNLHGTDRHGRSALALAALDGRVVLLNTLMECNGDIQESDHRKWTPLLAATFNRQSQILPNILKFNANINHQSQDGSSALLLAAYNQDEASFYYLLEQGANPLLETSLGNTALKQAVRNKDMNMIRALVHNNAHPETQDKTKQENAFMVAAEVGNIEALQYFITLGVNIDAQDHVGNRALTWAITKNNRPMLQWLIDQNANINLLDSHRKESPLALAARCGRYDMVRTLVDNNADLSSLEIILKKARGTSVRKYLNQLLEIVNINLPLQPPLEVKGCNLGVTFQNFAEIEQIDINQCLINGMHPLFWTVSHGLLKETKYLLEHGARLEDKYLLMTYAISTEDFLMVQCLVQQGVTIPEEAIIMAEEKRLFHIRDYLIANRH